jgi:2-polyprenyl-6-methoxyphenol hydroxylase-like FAD-dependent oxidoreductase
LEQDEDRVVAEVDVLESVSGGYAVAVQGTQVAKTLEIECQLLIGADGCGSLVRRQLDIEYESWGEVETFDVFEFDSDDDATGEVRIVLDDQSSNVLWTLPGGRQRWTFQVVGAELSDRDRVKSRLLMAVPGEASPRFSADLLRELIATRAPWFNRVEIGDIAWAGDVSFERRLAKELGRDRVWLVGDAVHQTGPVGVQSMNVGLLEARRLAAVARDAIKGKVGLGAFQDFAQTCVPGWCRLLGVQELFVANEKTDAWLADRLDRLVPCLPASGEDLALVGRQLGMGIAGED